MTDELDPRVLRYFVAVAEEPLLAYTEAQVAGCQETGMRVVIGCGGCAGSAP